MNEDLKIENDEFDDLLDDFIENQLQSATDDDTDDLATGYADEEEATFTFLNIDGYDYSIDALDCTKEPEVLEDLNVSIGGERYDSESVVMTGNFVQMIYDFRRAVRPDGEKGKIHFYLYRKGMSKVVSDELVPYRDGTVSVPLLMEAPGDYVMILTGVVPSGNLESMGFRRAGRCIYRQIHVHRAATVDKVEQVKARLVTSETLAVRVTMRYAGVDSEAEPSTAIAVQMVCYDKGLRKVGASLMSELPLKSNASMRQTFSLVPMSEWEDGEYRLVLNVDGYPSRFFRLTIGGSQRTLEAESADDNRDLEFAILYAERYKGWSPAIATLGGFGDGRRKLLELLRGRVLSDCREKAGLKKPCHPHHFVLMGDNRRAKRLVAEAIGELFNYESDIVVESDASELVATSQPNSYNAIREMFVESMSPVNVIRNVSAFFTADGQNALKYLLKEMREARNAVVLDCSKSEFARLMECSSEVGKMWEAGCRLEVEPFTASESIPIIEAELKKSEWRMSESAKAKLMTQLGRGNKRWREQELMDNVVQTLLSGAEQRVLNRLLSTVEELTWRELSTVEAEDVAIEVTDEITYDECMRPLMEMTGLDSLKKRLSEYFDMMRLNRLRRKAGLPAETETPLHVLFTGNPGTGKTTVAGHIGKIYKSLGLLSKGDVVRADRSRIVGEFIGQSEKNMASLIEEAQGNVLFIDEAYALCTDATDGRDFGRHALNVLLPHLSNPNSDMVVILAGYDKDMDRMLSVNQGMAGRFPQRFHFDDYTSDQLVTIGERIVAKLGYRFSAEAHSEFCKVVSSAVSMKDETWSNARWVEQLVNVGIRPALSRRVMRLTAIDEAALSTIEVSDVQAGANQMSVMCRDTRRRAIGFAV